MEALNCSQFLADHLESWLDGVRPAEAEAHLRDCPSCRSVASDVAAIASFARALADQDPNPPARVWVALRARMEEEGLIARDAAELVAQPGQKPLDWPLVWLAARGAMPRPALAVVYLALMAAGGFMIGSRHSLLQSNDTRWYQHHPHERDASQRRPGHRGGKHPLRPA
jgi:predicted anti-sigma-YlaC factor YlaD